MRYVSAVAVLFVLFVYTFFGSIGALAFPRVRWDQNFGKPADGYYASLAEGFLRGQASMAHRPDPRLVALPNPYDHASRVDIPHLWDASYFEGRYYLYFSPLPALLFHLPFRLLGRMYPSDQLAGTFFAAWAFVMAVGFVRHAVRRFQVPFPVWIITLGLAGVTPFVLPYSRTYEVAILCGTALSSTWAYALLRFLETRSTRWLVWSSVWLALAIAARPNLGVLVLVFFAAIVRFERKRVILAAVPLAIVGSALLLYNQVRFHDPLEFGHRYQLTYVSMAGRHVCGIRNLPELRRAAHHFALYTVALPQLTPDFPFADLRTAPLDPAVSFAAESDQVGGLVPLAPLAVLGSLLAFRRRDPATILVVVGGWLVLLGLSACWYVSARYELDFWFLISTGAIVAIERGRIASRTLRIATVVVALAGSLLGTMLGFNATSHAFAWFNPELFDRLSRLFQ